MVRLVDSHVILSNLAQRAAACLERTVGIHTSKGMMKWKGMKEKGDGQTMQNICEASLGHIRELDVEVSPKIYDVICEISFALLGVSLGKQHI